MILCREFGWTIYELRESPHDDVKNFIEMMGCEGQVAKLKRKAAGG